MKFKYSYSIFFALFVVVNVLSPRSARAEDRILWYSIGDGLTNTTKIQQAITFAAANNFNAICYLARYRADAYYQPNRDYSTYANSEPRRWSTTDPLQFTLDRAREAGLRVYVAFGCFLVTDGSNTYPAHLPSGSVTWIYRGSSPDTAYSPTTPEYPRAMTTADRSEGLWADPGRNDVRAYTRRILMDIVQNYDIDGIILDRIRYPGDSLPRYNQAYGYNPQALTDMGFSSPPGPGATAFITARRNAISNFISEARADVHSIKPWIIFAAAPVVYGTTLTSTYSTVYQHFPTWNAAPNSNHVSGYGNLDLLAPQYYRVTASANAALMDLVNADIDRNNRMYHQGIFAYLSTLTPPDQMAQNICDQRQKGMKGFGIFAYNDTVAAGFMSTLNGTATSPCGTNVMGGASPKVDYTLKVGWDSLPPNPITDLRADASQFGRVSLAWTQPAAAADGDRPVRYLIYRSGTTPVRLYYENLVNRNFTVTGTAFTDDGSTGFPGGTLFYRVIPVDKYNNKSDSNTFGPVQAASVDYIIETRCDAPPADCGQNTADYSEVSGDWQLSSSKSTAPGLTTTIGSRFATLTTKNDVARFTPSKLPTGISIYDIYFTSNNASSTKCENCAWRVNTSTGVVSGTFNILPATTGNVWYLIGRFTLNSTNAYIEFDSSSSTTTPSGTSTRIPMDAVKFSFISAVSTPTPTASPTPSPSPSPSPSASPSPSLSPSPTSSPVPTPSPTFAPAQSNLWYLY